jgi:hypothetical protein
MIEGFQNILDKTSQPDLVELGQFFEGLLGTEKRWKLVESTPLQLPNPRAYRLGFQTNGQTLSFVVKRLEPAIAQRNYLLLTRWLAAVGLADKGPTLVGVAADRDGKYLWQVYEDLGNWGLSGQSPLSLIKAAVELIAQVHLRFAGNPLLAECRLHGGDLGANFFAATVRDAIRCLEALRRIPFGLSPLQAGLCERLLSRLKRLSDEQLTRSRALEELGGPETLLHGDLWMTNTFVVPAPSGLQAHLIDWDHAAVGPISYDLSTFLLRFPSERRSSILELYREAVAPAGWHLPRTSDLNGLFETAEFSRFANRIIWPAIAFLRERADWAFESLAEVEQWFEEWKPVLECPSTPGDINSDDVKTSSQPLPREGQSDKRSSDLLFSAPK